MNPSINMKLVELIFGVYRFKYYIIKKSYSKVLERYVHTGKLKQKISVLILRCNALTVWRNKRITRSCGLQKIHEFSMRDYTIEIRYHLRNMLHDAYPFEIYANVKEST